MKEEGERCGGRRGKCEGGRVYVTLIMQQMVGTGSLGTRLGSLGTRLVCHTSEDHTQHYMHVDYSKHTSGGFMFSTLVIRPCAQSTKCVPDKRQSCHGLVPRPYPLTKNGLVTIEQLLGCRVSNNNADHMTSEQHTSSHIQTGVWARD